MFMAENYTVQVKAPDKTLHHVQAKHKGQSTLQEHNAKDEDR
jgi:hypothetical protein